MAKNVNHKAVFIQHLSRNSIIAIFFILFALIVGMVGYHVFENMVWVDAFANASMILSGMGPFGPLQTYWGKIFAGCYALFSGLVFIALISLIFIPVLHYIFRKIHLEFKDK